MSVPEKFLDLFTTSKRAFAHLATTMPSGAPQVTPVWFDYDGEHVIFNTARGRVKDRIMRKHPTIAFSVQDPANGYRYIQVRGKIVSDSEEGGYDSICDLRVKYHGDRNYPKREGEVRVIYKVRPEHANTMG